MKSQKEGRGVSLPIHNFGTKREWVVNCTPWLLYYWTQTQYSMNQKLGRPWAALER